MHRSVSFKQPFMYKLYLILIIVVLIIIGLSLWTSNDTAIGHKCFGLNADLPVESYQDIVFLEDISHSAKKPQPGKSIFFHETSCARNGQITLNAR